MTNYHHKGLRITVIKSSAGYTVSASAAEATTAEVTFTRTDGSEVSVTLTAGSEVAL